MTVMLGAAQGIADALSAAQGQCAELEEEMHGLRVQRDGFRDTLDSLSTQALDMGFAGTTGVEDALYELESLIPGVAILAQWHDGAHSGSRKFCDEEPCRSLIREGWSLSD